MSWSYFFFVNKDKERILKEIQEDREKLRLTKQAKVEVSSENTATQQTTSAAKLNQSSPETEKSTYDTASIQVRTHFKNNCLSMIPTNCVPLNYFCWEVLPAL